MILNRLPNELVLKLRANPFRRPNKYVLWNGHNLLSETVCKRCGLTLTCVGPDPRLTPTSRELKKTNERTIIKEVFVSRLRTPHYDTVEFEVEEPVPVFYPIAQETRDDEAPRLGVHRTSICKGCKHALLDGVNDIAEVQQLYEADLERMAAEDEVNLVPEAQSLKLFTQLATRRVLSVLN